MDGGLEWAAVGQCRGIDPALFFPEKGASRREIQAAKAVCAQCPVQEDCREWGLHHEHFGIWGGLTEKDRRPIRRALGIRFQSIELIVTSSPCGSISGVSRHRRLKEPLCFACRAAAVLAETEWRERRRSGAAAG